MKKLLAALAALAAFTSGALAVPNAQGVEVGRLNVSALVGVGGPSASAEGNYAKAALKVYEALGVFDRTNYILGASVSYDSWLHENDIGYLGLGFLAQVHRVSVTNSLKAAALTAAGYTNANNADVTGATVTYNYLVGSVGPELAVRYKSNTVRLYSSLGLGLATQFSPSLSVSVPGGSYNPDLKGSGDDSTLGFYLRPSVGVDIGNFSVAFTGQVSFFSETETINNTENTFKTTQYVVGLSTGFNF